LADPVGAINLAPTRGKWTFMPAEQHTSKPTIGVLLIHGFAGSKHDLAEMELLLRQRGIITQNMVLPGHGTTVRDLMAKGWKDWASAVRAELHELKQRCDAVFLVGHSLGGALALHTAAYEEVSGVVSMCAPIRMYPITRFLVRVGKFFTPFAPSFGEDIHDRSAYRRYTNDGYTWMPTRALESMMLYLPTLRAELARITAPALIMISLHDHVVPARDGREIYRLIGSKEKRLITFYNSYHVIMKDHDREEVFTRTLDFILQYAPARPVAKI
jgi:carboxylesterase